MTIEKLKILILEDEPADAELMEHELRRCGLDFIAIRADDERSFLEDLERFAPDIILCDYTLPAYNGAEALLAARRLVPHALFIFVSGTIGEERAVEALRLGATDYVLKDHLKRLPSVVEKAVTARDEEARRRLAEAALADSEERFRSLAESAVDAIIIMDPGMEVVFWNAAAERIFGYREDEILGRSIEIIVPERFHEVYARSVEEIASAAPRKRAGRIIESTGIRRDRSPVPVEISLSFSRAANKDFYTVIVRDITERKRSEDSIRKINRALMVLSGGNEVLVRAGDEEALLRDVCRIIVNNGGYRMAWAGYVADDRARSVEPMAWAGKEDGFLEAVRITLTAPELKDCPTVKAILTGRPVTVGDFLSSVCQAWQSEIVKRGYESCIALPLAQNGRPIGALTLYAGEITDFDRQEVELLMELASDLSYGINSQRTRALKEQAQKELEESETRVRQNLVRMRRLTGGIIQAMALTVETRDPYTAGHQRRVTDLARAIGHEMSLTSEQLEGLRTAGSIHDIGKIHIPSEILSKPGGLNPLERGLIQTHSQVGYDILKEIDFPWPVADIVLQHHERIDGSGYPWMLDGDDILLEARILSVADVVEAMSSHRPYRPALGIDRALAEISENSGRIYDAEAVSACLGLFREKGFEFERPASGEMAS